VTSQPVDVQSSEPPDEPIEVRRIWGGSWLFLAAIGLILLLAGVTLGAVGRRPTTVHVTTTVTVSATATVPVSGGSAGPVTAFRDGLYRVGVDIPAGNYHTGGGRDCYWERLNNLSGGFTGIIANGESTSAQSVRVISSDKAFSVKGGCEWSLVP
jgi:hypothetical protein